MQEYIEIKKFAELAGVSVQSIYKRIKKADNPIHNYLKQTDNLLTISKEALNVLYNKQVEQATLTTGLKVENEKDIKDTDEKKENINQVYSNKMIKILQEQIEAQRKDIEQKNLQIEKLNNMLIESQKMIDQQQRLSMADKQQILLLQDINKKSERHFGFFNWFRKNKNSID